MTYPSWGEIARIATDCGSKYPQLVAAQWALESAWGDKTTGKNNYFGIKGSPGTLCSTTEYVNGRPITVHAEFKNFETPGDCIKYIVSRWYLDYTNPRNGNKFNGVNRASSRDEAAKLLVTEGYATDPDYAEKLIKLMNTNTANQPAQVINKRISLVDAAKWFSGKPHQVKAFMELERKLSDQLLAEFASMYRNPPVPADQQPSNVSKFPLDVPYFWQRDSKTGHGERSCQSSAIAMAVKYINKSIISDDDDYLNIVLRYGDTVSQAAQAKALDSLGIKHQFSQNGSIDTLLKILDAGYPLPIGILHKGNISSPSGGGHWICAIGYDDDNFYVNDPFGELDLINGGYPYAGPTDGKRKKYSKKNLMKRWLISSSSDGWYWDLSKNAIK